MSLLIVLSSTKWAGAEMAVTHRFSLRLFWFYRFQFSDVRKIEKGKTLTIRKEDIYYENNQNNP